MAILKFYADTEFGIYNQVKNALENAYEKSGKPWTNSTSGMMRKQAVKILEKRYQEKLEEMLRTHIANELPQIPQEFSVSVDYTIPASFGLQVIIESEAWNECLTDRGWEEVKTSLFAFLHNATVWEDGAQDWKTWQRKMLLEVLQEVNA